MEAIDSAVQSVVQGRFTTQQVLIAIAAVVGVLIVIKILKGLIKNAIIIGIVAVLAVYFGIATPTQIKDLATDTAKSAYAKYQLVSNSVDMEDGEVYIIIGEHRLPVSEIVSYKKTLDGKIQILTANGTFTSEDKELGDFLAELSK